MQVESELRDGKFKCGLEALEYHSEIGRLKIVPSVLDASAKEGLTPPFEDVTGYIDVIVRPAIDQLWQNSRSETEPAMREEIRQRVKAQAAPYALDFPEINDLLAHDIPDSVEANVILEQIVSRVVRQAERLMRMHGIRTRKRAGEVRVIFCECDDGATAVDANTDRSTNTITMMINPGRMTCTDYVLLDYTLLHEFFSHISGGLSIQEVGAGPMRVSTYFDGLEWEALAEEYPGIRVMTDVASPSRRDLALHVARERQSLYVADEAHLGAQAAEGVRSLLTEAERPEQIWKLIDAVHSDDYVAIDPRLGHDVIVMSALSWLKDTLSLTTPHRLEETRRLAAKLSRVERPIDAVAAFS